MDKARAGRIVDLEDVLQRLNGDWELLGELALFFREDAPGLMLKLKQAIANADAQGVHQAAHAIKGMAANLGARATVETARQLELFGKQAALDEAPAVFAKLRQHVDELLAALPELTRPSGH